MDNLLMDNTFMDNTFMDNTFMDNKAKSVRSKRIAIMATILAALLIPILPLSPIYGASIESMQQSVLGHRTKGNLKAAVEVQANIIKRLLEQKSEQNTSLNIIYYNMGILQYESDNFLAAKLALEKSISLTKKTYGPLHESTLNGLTSLGLLLLREEFLESAMESFSEAQHIMHRSYGVRSTKQEALLDWMSKIHLEQNHFGAADTLQRLNYETYKATYGPLDPRSVPALLKLGVWLQRSGQYTDSINRFEDAIHIIRNNELPSEILHEALSGIAKTYYLKGKCCAGEYMAEAAHAIKDNIKFDIIDKHRAFLRAADMSLFMQDNTSGKKLYEEAAEFGMQSTTPRSHPHILGISRIDRMITAYRPFLEDRIIPNDNAIHEPGPPVQAKLVGTPVPMCASEISELSKNKDYANYIIDLEFEVSVEGRANNIKIVNSNAPIAVNRLFRRLVHHYRFRPSLVDGKPATEKMQLHQTFGETIESANQFAVGKVATIHGCNLLATI